MESFGNGGTYSSSLGFHPGFIQSRKWEFRNHFEKLYDGDEDDAKG